MMRLPIIALFLSVIACNDATGPEDGLSGLYFLHTVNGMRPPLTEFDGCDTFPAGSGPTCEILDGFLTMLDGDFLLSITQRRNANPLLPGGLRLDISGRYRVTGRRIEYNSAEFPSFSGDLVSDEACAPQAAFDAVTFLDDQVELLFCRVAVFSQ